MQEKGWFAFIILSGMPDDFFGHKQKETFGEKSARCLIPLKKRFTLAIMLDGRCL